MKIMELKGKIIDVEDFFKLLVDELMKKTKFKRFHFLLPDGKNGDFVTHHSTHGLNIRLTKKELSILGEDITKDILYPKAAFKRNNSLRRILFIKINWKIRLHGISAIMPLYCDNNRFICLILFTDRRADDWLHKNFHCINKIKQEITYCLEAILLYNQTLERIIREHNCLNIRTNCHVTRLTDEQALASIDDKVQFL